MSHLDDDFAATLELVQELRETVVSAPLIDDFVNPAARLLANEQLHLRGLARLIGPTNVIPEISGEFKAASKLGRDLTKTVALDSQSGVIPILRDTQTHVRGCAAILSNAKSAPVDSGDEDYGKLFEEPKPATAMEVQGGG